MFLTNFGLVAVDKVDSLLKRTTQYFVPDIRAVERGINRTAASRRTIDKVSIGHQWGVDLRELARYC